MKLSVMLRRGSVFEATIPGVDDTAELNAALNERVFIHFVKTDGCDTEESGAFLHRDSILRIIVVGGS